MTKLGSIMSVSGWAVAAVSWISAARTLGGDAVVRQPEADESAIWDGRSETEQKGQAEVAILRVRMAILQNELARVRACVPDAAPAPGGDSELRAEPDGRPPVSVAVTPRVPEAEARIVDLARDLPEWLSFGSARCTADACVVEVLNDGPPDEVALALQSFAGRTAHELAFSSVEIDPAEGRSSLRLIR